MGLDVLGQISDFLTNPESLEQVAALSILPGAMLVAYRLSLRSHSAAIAIYKAAAADADARLSHERKQWVEERAMLESWIRELHAQLRSQKREGGDEPVSP